MYPILFYIGPFPVFSYGVFVVLGLIALYAIALGTARREGRNWDQLLPMAFGVMVGGVVGARLSHIILEPQKAMQLLDFYSMFRPGTPGNIVGLMVGGFAGGLVVRKSLGLPSQGNFYAPAMAAASAIWRIGCTLAGCCHGKETDLPWPLSIHLDGEDVHPTMIYEGLFNFVMFFVLWRLRPRIKQDNALVYLYFASYAFFRFWLEFLRTYPVVAFGLTGAQLLCLGILIGLGIWWWRQWAHRENSTMAVKTTT